MDSTLRGLILKLLEENRTMSLATLRPDGWPQATTVSFVHDDLTLYFLCAPESQKARNLARDNRVSLTIDREVDQVMEIKGLSMAAHADLVTDPVSAERVMTKLITRYGNQIDTPGPSPAASEARVFRVTPMVISVLDYSKGFGHVDLVVL